MNNLTVPLHPFARSARSVVALLAIMVAVLAAPSKAQAQTTLTQGDLAIIGATYDSTPYMLSVVALRDIAAGTVIRISDYSYDPSTAEVSAVSLANLNEGSITWTTGAIAAGTVYRFSISCPVTGVPAVTMSPVNGSFTVNGWTSTGGATVCPCPAGGDNWFIYQGGTASSFAGATFINAWVNTFGVNYFSVDYPRGTFLTNPPHTVTNVTIGFTFLPPSLTNNTNAIALNRDPADATSPGYHGDNNVYIGTKTGTKTQLLTAISTIANWNTSETTVYDISSGGTQFPGAVPFTVTVPDTTPPFPISINRQPQTSLVVSGASTVFRVTFSESVTGVDVSDFTLVKAGSVVGTVASIAGSGAVYDVTVNGISGFGTLRLDLKGSGTGIVDGASNAVAHGFFWGQIINAGTSMLAGWGNDASGQLGDGTSGTGNNKAFAVATDLTGAINGKNVVALTGTANVTIALTADNFLYAWGGGAQGVLGNGTSPATATTAPVPVTMNGALNGKTIIKVAGGSSFCMALDSNGALYGWGVGSSGQLGDGLNTSGNVPVATTMTGALNGKTVVDMACGSAFAIACTSDGGCYTWGASSSGQLGNGTTTPNVLAPALISGSGVLSGKRIVSVGAGGTFAVALSSDGKVYTWGNNTNGFLGDGGTVGTPANNPTPAAVMGTGLPGGKTIAKIHVGNVSVYALATDGTLYSWGNGATGALGNGSAAISTSPVQVDLSGVLAGKTIVHIGGGNSWAYVLTSDGSAYSWGSNSANNLGDGTLTQRNNPVAVDTTASSVLNGKFVGFISTGGQPGGGMVGINAAAPAVAPTISNISSTKPDGTYGATTLIPITVTFSAPVDVTGTPTLSLNSGGTATYASGTGSSTLTFNYTVAATQNSADLDYSGTSALALATGTINGTTGGAAATLTLPSPGTANSLGANKAIVIDTTAPTILSINRLTPSGQTTGSSTVTFRVTYSEAVTGMTNSSFSVVAVNSSNIVGTVTGVSNITSTSCDVSVSITSGTGEFRLSGVN